MGTDYKVYEKHGLKIWVTIVIVPIALLVIGYLLDAEVVWDGFLWKYYWAPIEADALDRPVDGITESYNIVDTTTYGLVLVASVYWIYRLFKHLEIRTGTRVVFATVPYVITGGVLRALEDAALFPRPSVYLFIAPIIYVFIGLTTVVLLLAANMAERRGRSSGVPSGLTVTGTVFAVIVLVYVAVYTTSEPKVNVDNLMHPVLFAVIAVTLMLFLNVMARRRGRVDSNDQYFASGILLLTLALYPASIWFVNGGTWIGSGAEAAKLLGEQLVQVVGLALIVTACVVASGYLMKRTWKWTGIYAKPVNALLIFSHMFDAAATFTAIESYGYSEKHVLPGFLIEATGTGLVMFPLKIIVIAVVLYILEVEVGKDLRKEKVLLAIIRIAIFVLGMAPGTRDLARLAMGV